MEGWKTIIVNALLGSLALVAEVLTQLTDMDWKSVVPPDLAPYIIVAIALANIYLRHVTKGPAGWMITAPAPGEEGLPLEDLPDEHGAGERS